MGEYAAEGLLASRNYVDIRPVEEERGNGGDLSSEGVDVERDAMEKLRA